MRCPESCGVRFRNRSSNWQKQRRLFPAGRTIPFAPGKWAQGNWADGLLEKFDLQPDATTDHLRRLLEKGVSYHHAGLLPTLKEVIERIFTIPGMGSLTFEAINLRDLAELLVQANGGGRYSVRSYPADRQPIDIGDYYADFNRIKSSLGWEPTVPLSQALERTDPARRLRLTQEFQHPIDPFGQEAC